jgi:hypothetical protein
MARHNVALAYEHEYARALSIKNVQSQRRCRPRLLTLAEWRASLLSACEDQVLEGAEEIRLQLRGRHGRLGKNAVAKPKLIPLLLAGHVWQRWAAHEHRRSGFPVERAAAVSSGAIRFHRVRRASLEAERGGFLYSVEVFASSAARESGWTLLIRAIGETPCH